MTIKVYDWQGNEITIEELRAKYGDFVIVSALDGIFPQWQIRALRERADGDFDPAELMKDFDPDWKAPEAGIEAAPALVVKTVNENGAPLKDVRVAFYWPDAPFDGNAGPAGGVHEWMTPNRAVSGPTNLEGDVGFGMGAGAYYWPAVEIGPHAVWVYGAGTNSDLILGLGMVAATNHYHFDVEYELVMSGDPEPPEPPLPPPPGYPVDPDVIMVALAQIRQAANDIEAQLVC